MDAGEAIAHLPDPEEYEDADDALREVLDLLTFVPGLEGFEWLEVFERTPGDVETSVDTQRGTLHLTFTGSVYDAWELTATFRQQEIKVVCEFMNDGYSDSEGSEVPSHFRLMSSAEGHAQRNPAWAINDLILSQVVGSNTVVQN
ncbi:MAG: hypothetical protein JWL79_149 [Frankiales bacterium]|nr:hypothetical protein [Frankiales bacterium]